MNSDQVLAQLKARFENADIEVTSPDDVHFAARIVSAEFDGLSQVKRHQLVYQALGGVVGHEVHALSLQTLTPTEAEAASHG